MKILNKKFHENFEQEYGNFEIMEILNKKFYENFKQEIL